MASDRQLRTGVWYGDHTLQLDFPAGWDARFVWPQTPPPLTGEQIREALEQPVGQPAIRHLCRGKSRPLILVDDLNRPSPATRVIPFVLRQIADAGIPSHDVTILMAGGSHGHSPDAVQKKVGSPAAKSCRLCIHDPARRGVRVGRTPLGSPVLVNPEVVASDFVMGIGGVYPSSMAGFGGGTKLALGVLELSAISYLHHRHSGAGRGTPAIEGSFRQDLNEIARMIGLKTVISLHLNADRDVVRVACGDPLLYYPEEMAFARESYRAPPPDDADVVIANAYPNDLSFTSVWQKSMSLLRCCAVGASRIMIASCSEGVGSHGVFPVVNAPRFHTERDYLRRLTVLGTAEIGRKIVSRFLRAPGSGSKHEAILKKRAEPRLAFPKNPVWLYRPGVQSVPLPSTMRGVHIRESWTEIVQAVKNEQGGRDRLKVLLYPCAPLQYLEQSDKDNTAPVFEADD